MRPAALPLLTVVLMSGCANLTAVREFAQDTRQISAAFDPLLGQTIEHCRAGFLDKRLYTTDQPLARFDATEALARASQACQSLEASNTIAQGMSQALADYATRLGALADAGVVDSVSDDYTRLSTQLGQFSAQSLAQARAAQQARAATQAVRARFETLTPREREVLALMVQGLRNKQSADRLGISEVTVKVHRHHVMEKMGARSLPMLVDLVDRLGLRAAPQTDAA